MKNELVSIDDLRINGYPVVVGISLILNKLINKRIKDIVFDAFNISSLLSHYQPSYDYRLRIDDGMELHDVYKLINVYGFGVCKQFVVLMGYLLDSLYVKNRILYLGKKGSDCFDHFAIEVFYDNAWHYFDPNLHILFLNNSDVASVRDIKNKRFNKIIGEFDPSAWISSNSGLAYLEDKELFRRQYFRIFEAVEEFTLDDDRFPYKCQLMKKQGVVRWYKYNEKKYLFPKHIKLSEDMEGYGISSGRLIKSNHYIKFSNITFCFNVFNEYSLTINDFPLLIVGLKLFSSNIELNINILINGIKYNICVNSGDDILKKISDIENIYNSPIYSIYLYSDVVINKYSLTVMRSNFVKLLSDYLEI